MAVKTPFSDDDFRSILSQYNLGDYGHSEPLPQGTVQTNYRIHTTQGTFVFRHYENRSEGSVLFESDLLTFLAEHHYPCPAQVKNSRGTCVGLYRRKPYVIFEFVAGRHIESPRRHHWRQLIQKAAELQNLTQDFRSPHAVHRWHYTPDLCRELARTQAARINSVDSRAKYAWLRRELAGLDLPPSLPTGICHGDFHLSNVLFRDDEFVALLDFDDANITYLPFDLVGLVEYWAWPDRAARLDLTRARDVVQEYENHRPLSAIERRHLYDVYKFSILLDCVWYFERGAVEASREKRKIEALADLGRQRFYAALFHA